MATAKPITFQDDSTIQRLEDEMRDLENRLRHGEGIVRQERDRGTDRERVDYLETHWIRLLRNYELLYDRLHRQLALRRDAEPPSL